MELILYICKKLLVLDFCNKYCRSRLFIKRSFLLVCIYLFIKFNIVSYKVVKVFKDNNGFKCWRKIWNGLFKFNLLFNLIIVIFIVFVILIYFYVYLNKFYVCILKKILI